MSERGYQLASGFAGLDYGDLDAEPVADFFAIREYDLIEDRWMRFPGNGYIHAAGAVFVTNNKLYIVGGLVGIDGRKVTSAALHSTVSRFDPISHTWESVAEFRGTGEQRPADLMGAFTLQPVDFGTGCEAGELARDTLDPLDDLVENNPPHDRPPLTRPFNDDAGNMLPFSVGIESLLHAMDCPEKPYVQGGSVGGQFGTDQVLQNKNFGYQEGSDAWTAEVPFRQKKENFAATAAYGKGYVIGGDVSRVDEGLNDFVTDVFERFDGVVWERLGELLPIPGSYSGIRGPQEPFGGRRGSAAELLGDGIHLAGGADHKIDVWGVGDGGSRSLPVHDVYNIQARTWRRDVPIGFIIIEPNFNQPPFDFLEIVRSGSFALGGGMHMIYNLDGHVRFTPGEDEWERKAPVPVGAASGIFAGRILSHAGAAIKG